MKLRNLNPWYWKKRAVSASTALIALGAERIELRKELLEYCGFLRGSGIAKKYVNTLRDLAEGRHADFNLDLDEFERSIDQAE